MNQKYVSFDDMQRQLYDSLSIWNKVIYNLSDFIERSTGDMPYIMPCIFYDKVSKEKNKSEVLQDCLEVKENCEIVFKDDFLVGRRPIACCPRVVIDALCQGHDLDFCRKYDELLLDIVMNDYDYDAKFADYKKSRYKTQIHMFLLFFRNAMFSKNLYTTNLSLVQLLINIRNVVLNRIIPWHDSVINRDIINETNYAESESLIDLLKSINNALLDIQEHHGKEEKENEIIKYLEEDIKKLTVLTEDADIQYLPVKQ